MIYIKPQDNINFSLFMPYIITFKIINFRRKYYVFKSFIKLIKGIVS
jgi:hypothetical protein